MGVHRGEQMELPVEETPNGDGFVDPEPNMPPDNEDEPGDDGDGTDE
jgi:hypothetical protein